MKEALLPSLGNNIISGNSLIEWDVVKGKLFETNDERELHPLNFEDKFPMVIQRGGFDAIIGNPPWGATFSETALAYLRKKYQRVVARTVLLPGSVDAPANLRRNCRLHRSQHDS